MVDAPIVSLSYSVRVLNPVIRMDVDHEYEEESPGFSSFNHLTGAGGLWWFQLVWKSAGGRGYDAG